jgi:hypothetical protein
MPRPRWAQRSVHLTRRLDLFLVCAVGAVLGNRAFLIITGYPQLGNGTLHISHAIWGALMMAIAVIIAISYLPPSTRGFVAFLGGAGFGWFIDELGKFITRKVNYFFQPTIALIYLVFVAMYLVFRSIERRSFSPDEAVLNGLDALKSASIGELDDAQRVAAVSLIDSTEASGAIARHVRGLLLDVPALPARSPGAFARAGRRFRDRYERFTQRHGFVIIVNTLMILIAIAKILLVVTVALDHNQIHGFSEWASVISALAAGVFIAIGTVELPRSRLQAYRWFDRGLLVDILVTQVFEFAQQQLSGLTGLVITIGIWFMVRSAIRVETERALGSENAALGSVNSIA